MRATVFIVWIMFMMLAKSKGVPVKCANVYEKVYSTKEMGLLLLPKWWRTL